MCVRKGANFGSRVNDRSRATRSALRAPLRLPPLSLQSLETQVDFAAHFVQAEFGSHPCTDAVGVVHMMAEVVTLAQEEHQVVAWCVPGAHDVGPTDIDAVRFELAIGALCDDRLDAADCVLPLPQAVALQKPRDEVLQLGVQLLGCLLGCLCGAWPGIGRAQAAGHLLVILCWCGGVRAGCAAFACVQVDGVVVGWCLGL